MKNITKPNGLNLFVMFSVGALAALCTLFFGITMGVRSPVTILLRVVMSFALFSAVGFLIAQFLKGELATVTPIKPQKNTEAPPMEKKAEDEEIPLASKSKTPLEQDQNEKNEDDKSFERIVVVNHDDDQ